MLQEKKSMVFLLQKHIPFGGNQMISPNLSFNMNSVRLKLVIRAQTTVYILALPLSGDMRLNVSFLLSKSQLLHL